MCKYVRASTTGRDYFSDFFSRVGCRQGRERQEDSFLEHHTNGTCELFKRRYINQL